MPDDWWNEPINSRILLKDGVVVNADSNSLCDVMINNGVIKKVAKNIRPDGKSLVLDVSNMYIMPGGIDPNTHLEYEFMKTTTIDDFYCGTSAAVSGGTTTVIDFAVPKLDETFEEAYRKWRKKADHQAVCDYGLHMTITHWNTDVCRAMGQMVISSGISSFMMYMTHVNDYMLTDSELYHAILKCRRLGAIPMLHAENGLIFATNCKRLLANEVRCPEAHYLASPEEIEAEATNRACVIAKQVTCPIYICNVMSDAAAEIIATKKREGQPVFGETIAAALGSRGAPVDSNFKVAAAHITCPPINRNRINSAKLMKRLANEELIIAASNHRPYSNLQKLLGKHNFTKIPYGVNGIEYRMSVVWEKGVNAGILSPSQFVATTSTNAAKMFGLYPKKGVIQVGSDADIVVWDPNKYKKISHHNHRQTSDNNIFDGMEIHGQPQYVLVKGKLCVDNGVFRVERGFGEYLYRSCHPQIAYEGLAVRNPEIDDYGDEIFTNVFQE